MLEGKNVNLRVMEKEDLPLFAEWYNNPEFMGEALFPTQRSMAETEKAFLEPNPLARALLCHLQHSPRGMERTKNTNKNPLNTD